MHRLRARTRLEQTGVALGLYFCERGTHLHKERSQRFWIVRDETVRAQGKEASSLIRVIDDPEIYAQSEGVALIDNVVGIEAQRTITKGDLGSVSVEGQGAEDGTRGEGEAEYLQAREPCFSLVVSATHVMKDGVREACDGYTGLGVVATNDGNERLGHVGGDLFGVNVEGGIRKGEESFFERGDSIRTLGVGALTICVGDTLADIPLLEISEDGFTDGGKDAGVSSTGGVVGQDDVSIGAHMSVRFDGMAAITEGTVEGGKGVFRVFPGRASVSVEDFAMDHWRHCDAARA